MTQKDIEEISKNKITDVKFNEEFRQKMIKLLNAKSVEDIDWGGLYFNNTDYGDVILFRHNVRDTLLQRQKLLSTCQPHIKIE